MQSLLDAKNIALINPSATNRFRVMNIKRIFSNAHHSIDTRCRLAT